MLLDRRSFFFSSFLLETVEQIMKTVVWVNVTSADWMLYTIFQMLRLHLDVLTRKYVGVLLLLISDLKMKVARLLLSCTFTITKQNIPYSSLPPRPSLRELLQDFFYPGRLLTVGFKYDKSTVRYSTL